MSSARRIISWCVCGDHHAVCVLSSLLTRLFCAWSGEDQTREEGQGEEPDDASALVQHQLARPSARGGGATRHRVQRRGGAGARWHRRVAAAAGLAADRGPGRRWRRARKRRQRTGRRHRRLGSQRGRRCSRRCSTCRCACSRACELNYARSACICAGFCSFAGNGCGAYCGTCRCTGARSSTGNPGSVGACSSHMIIPSPRAQPECAR
jgi:hypothetical protein